jgi:hypothetical protein
MREDLLEGWLEAAALENDLDQISAGIVHVLPGALAGSSSAALMIASSFF